jgi:prevent-host-death family protein
MRISIMNAPWQLQEAKNRFSEVVDEALHKGPQTVTRHGQEVVVIISAAERISPTETSTNQPGRIFADISTGGCRTGYFPQ